MKTIRINDRTQKGKFLIALLKKLEKEGVISVEKIPNWKSIRATHEAKYGKATICKSIDDLIKILREEIELSKTI